MRRHVITTRGNHIYITLPKNKIAKLIERIPEARDPIKGTKQRNNPSKGIENPKGKRYNKREKTKEKSQEDQRMSPIVQFFGNVIYM